MGITVHGAVAYQEGGPRAGRQERGQAMGAGSKSADGVKSQEGGSWAAIQESGVGVLGKVLEDIEGRFAGNEGALARQSFLACKAFFGQVLQASGAGGRVQRTTGPVTPSPLIKNAAVGCAISPPSSQSRRNSRRRVARQAQRRQAASVGRKLDMRVSPASQAGGGGQQANLEKKIEAKASTSTIAEGLLKPVLRGWGGQRRHGDIGRSASWGDDDSDGDAGSQGPHGVLGTAAGFSAAAAATAATAATAAAAAALAEVAAAVTTAAAVALNGQRAGSGPAAAAVTIATQAAAEAAEAAEEAAAEAEAADAAVKAAVAAVVAQEATAAAAAAETAADAAVADAAVAAAAAAGAVAEVDAAPWWVVAAAVVDAADATAHTGLGPSLRPCSAYALRARERAVQATPALGQRVQQRAPGGSAGSTVAECAVPAKRPTRVKQRRDW
jgi:trimeric autotransporter adhesin